MQPISSFNSNLGTAILLLGPPGAGKTTLGCRLFPKTYVSVTDLNFKSGIDYLTKIKEVTNIIGFDTPALNETGGRIASNLRYTCMLGQLGKAMIDPNVDCIFCDSITFIEDIIKGKICNAASDEQIKLTGFEQWGSYLLVWKSLIMQLRQSGKKLIMSGHEEKEQDAADRIFKHGLAVDGKIKTKFAALFSDVWRCEVAENVGKHTWQVRTLGNTSHELKNTFGFPAVITQDDLVKKVRETLPKP